MRTDIADIFMNTEAFAVELSFYQSKNHQPVAIKAQHFDDESDMGSVLLKRIVCSYDDISQILSTDGYFIIDGDKYGVKSYESDEHHLMMYILAQKGR